MQDGWLRVTARDLLARSQTLIRASLWLEARHPRADLAGEPTLRVSREEYVANHVAIAELARSHGAQAAVIGPVYRDAITDPEEAHRLAGHRRALANRLRRLGIPYLEIEELVETAYPATLDRFGERIHPNAEGHRIMAEALLVYLEDQGLLERLALHTSLHTSS
jgi:lysophospholipase L1-like esterase